MDKLWQAEQVVGGASRFTSAKNLCATSDVSRRSRFFENTAWFHTLSSMPRPTDKRKSSFIAQLLD